MNRRDFLATCLVVVGATGLAGGVPFRGRGCSFCSARAVAGAWDQVGFPQGGYWAFRGWAFEAACDRHRTLLRARSREFPTKTAASDYVTERMGAEYAARVMGG